MEASLSWFAPWINAGAAAVMTALVVWFVTRGFPSLLERADRREDKVRDHYEAESEKDRNLYRESITTTCDAIKELTAEVRAQRCNYRETRP